MQIYLGRGTLDIDRFMIDILQTSLQKHAGLAFIELVNEGSVLLIRVYANISI